MWQDCDYLLCLPVPLFSHLDRAIVRHNQKVGCSLSCSGLRGLASDAFLLAVELRSREVPCQWR